MKKMVIFLLIFISFTQVFANELEDNSIIEELDKNLDVDLVSNLDFKLQKFNSCENFDDIMSKYIKDYWKNNNYPVLYRNFWWIMEDAVIEESIESDSSMKAVESIWWDRSDFSETNIQVDWVDESDIIKTDWEYIYYYNQLDKYVYIVKAYPEDELEIVKKIKLPKNFSSPVLYLWQDRLTIVSSGYSNWDYSKRWYWINRNSKTYTIVFDTTKITSPKLLKLYISDGDLSKTRKIWKYLYVLSNNHFNIPYYNFKEEDDIDIEINKIIPKWVELSKTSVKSDQNLVIKGKKLPYNLKAGSVVNCDEIEYILPDSETIKKFDFNPSYNIISVIDTESTINKVKTKVIAWSNSEIYMSLDNLYLTSNIYGINKFKCPVDTMCIMPWFPRWNNTLIHKINIDKNNLSYQDSTIVPWEPLTQYSMDEKDWNFRIITKKWDPRETGLYILDKDLKLKWELTWLWEEEDFKSSRFIWDKLFLVTFKQVDPLFVIDLSDITKPKVLWELKIPWYSKYLHPFDNNHLIGLGYNTTENEWWWTVNNWLKVDLYEINYDKKCWDSNLTENENKLCKSWDYKWMLVKQKYSKTLWERSSYSEALNNPRMFMWNSKKNNLLLPVNLYKNDKISTYKHIDFFNWMVSLNIDKDNWIKENYRITHLDTIGLKENRLKDCSKYNVNSDELECKILLDWSKYCPSNNRNYVPTYCYADSPIWEYLASRNWNYKDSFIKRALWIWDNSYTVSNKKIVVSNLENGYEKKSVEMK